MYPTIDKRILRYSQDLDDTTGQLLRASMNVLELEVGCSGSIFYTPVTCRILQTRDTLLANTYILTGCGAQITGK
jgi:hypothetical protein